MYRLGVVETDIDNIVTYDAKKYNSLREMFSSISSGGYVKIPIGTYNETYVVLNGLSDLVIEGNGFLSKIRFNDMISTLDGAPYYKTGEGVHFVVHNCSNIRFKNFAIEGVYDNRTTGSYSHGFVVSGTSDDIYIEDVSISKFCGEGVLNNSTGTVHVDDCLIQSVRNSGIGSANTGGIKGRRNVLKNVCYQTLVSGISVNSTWDFQDNYIETMQTGAKIGHTGKTGSGKIINNKFVLIGTLATQTCFAVEVCDGLEISGNYVQGYYYGLNASAWILGNGNDLTIRNNVFKNIANIAMSSFISKTCLVIENNTVDTAVDGIVLHSGVAKSRIVGNVIKNITGIGIKFLATSVSVEHMNNYISRNIVTGGTYGLYIGGRNGANIVKNDNIFTGQSTKDIYLELSNTYSTTIGTIMDYVFATTPVLDGTPDNTNQTPSLNNGNFYVLPAGNSGALYNVVRFDNACLGQTVSFLAVDAYTVFKNGNNISLAADVTTVAGKTYTFKSIANGGTLKYYLVSVN